MLKVDELFCVYAFGVAVFVIIGLLLLRIHINVINLYGFINKLTIIDIPILLLIFKF